eukprot:1998138-Pyramimonas_sp.AAC.1
MTGARGRPRGAPRAARARATPAPGVRAPPRTAAAGRSVGGSEWVRGHPTKTAARRARRTAPRPRQAAQ